MINEQINEELSTTIKGNSKERFVSTNIELSQPNQEVRNEERSYASLKILDKSKRSKSKVRKMLKQTRGLGNILDEYKS